MPSIELKSVGKLNLKLVPECSALWVSPSQPGVFWTLADSGAKSAIIPIRADGTLVPVAKSFWGAVMLKGATNVDWEAITGDTAGTMVVGDVGNNVSRRKELAFYLFKEPKPGVTEVTEVRKVTFAWPDQTAFPDPKDESGRWVAVKVTPVDNSVFNGPQKEQWLMSPGSTPARGFLATGLHNDAPLAIYNRSNFHDERFSTLYTQALAQPDLAQRKLLVHEAQRIQHERGGLLIWGFNDVLDAASTRVGGLTPEQTTFASWRFDELWLNHA